MSKSIIRHAIILVGGFGTRLQTVVEDVPKPMAPIDHRPFLQFQLDYLSRHGFENVILCTGYKAEIIKNHFNYKYKSLSIIYSHEETPLGTGGAIKQALAFIPKNEDTVILNGDSFFQVDLQKMYLNHLSSSFKTTLALRYMYNFDRYGSVIIDDKFIIKKFTAKQKQTSGWINGGVYIANQSIIDQLPSKLNFSIELDYFEPVSELNDIGAFLSDSYFIDIGIPEDYTKAQELLPILNNKTYSDWTIFLDRDGVINERIPGSYVKSQHEWVYCNGALDVIVKLSYLFNRIVVVTNQQGVGLNKMSSYQLDQLHQNLLDDVLKSGGYIDKIYASTDLKEKPNNSRKPNTTMALWAKNDFPDIDFSKSIMIGDSASDIKFGKDLGMKTVHILGKKEDYQNIQKLTPNWHSKSLLAWFSDFI